MYWGGWGERERESGTGGELVYTGNWEINLTLDASSIIKLEQQRITSQKKWTN